ncbi:MAG: hypothetical protein QG628_700, partial [Patescibacteria group bacterium]|nr:hypothetical protein [Patescibacteria group bacterium]
DGVFIDTDNNAVDFSGDQDVSVRSTSTIKTNEVTISELLPNPASPIPDATGEFIELHNATELDIALRGFKLLTGSTLSHSYVFKDQVIAAHQYMAFYVTDTGTTLSNSGGKAQLQDPVGNIMSETSSYTKADDGQAWAFDGANWQWTATPTPNAENSVLVATSALASKVSKAKSTKKVTAKKAKATGKVKGATTANAAKSADTSDAFSSPMHTPVLAGVGGLAVLYGVYEYRQDIANAYRKFRGNRGART